MLPAMAVPSGFFMENGRYEFLLLLDGLPPPSDVAVLVNDVPRDCLIRAGRAIFPYEAEFAAGAIRVDVVRARRVVASVEIVVDPAVAKLTRDEYAAMIAEISEATLALYRLGGATVAAAVGPSGQRSDVVTLDLVRTNIDAFERAVGRIADRPLRVLRSAVSETAIEHAKHLDDRALEGALRSRHARPASDAETRASPALVAALRGAWIPRIVERTGYESINIYEHRAILGFVRWLDAALGDMARRLSVRSAYSPDPAAAVQAARLALWRARLGGLARRSLFAQLRPDWHLRPTSAFRMRPDYAAAFNAMARMRSGLGGKVSAAPAVPLERTHVLYEIWCYVLILRAAAERYPAARAGVASILRGCASPSELGVRLLQGMAPAVHLEPSLRLTYQRRFSPMPDAGGARTLVVDAIPDIVLERLAPLGQVAGVVVLDPKYRTGASLLEGIRDLHVYRDAVLGSDGSPLVRAAVALAPRATFPPPIVGRLPRAAPCVAVARPGHDPAVFGRLLEATIEALANGRTELQEAS
ncbi:DUF2357 domain-containing protein [Roseomonas sp. F4]